MSGPRYGAGMPVDDHCRVCKEARRHTVVVADSEGRPLRVVCDSCGSTHNFRGVRGAPERAESGAPPRESASRNAGSVVSARETRGASMSTDDPGTSVQDLELLIRRVVREECGVTPVALGEKWQGGELVLKPGREGLQDKRVPLETFFAKIIAVRNRLRVLEQQISGADLPDELKIKLAGYVTAAYGSLTTFNVLFADEDDRFKGRGS